MPDPITYASVALEQIPRLLSLEDRNPYSKTYGSFKRTYWLDKTVAFPDGLPQYGVLSLTLAYAHQMPGNIYEGQPKILEWILAGMRYWTEVQHGDGSFDEFYINERGWTGPTGFLLYGMMRSYLLLKDKGVFPPEFEDQFLSSCRKAADYICKYDEHGVLANHHAIAVLPVAYAQHVFRDPKLDEGYEAKLADFLSYHHPNEGWSLEYDGADIGYLSATVSFLGKAYKLNGDPRLKEVMEQATDFLSYFVYPNGFYAGSAGSRQTLHFYSHGVELLATESPLARAVADAMLEALGDGKIVRPGIQSDRYFLYRIPEHLESYLDAYERDQGSGVSGQHEKLPYERDDFQKYFPEARCFLEKKGKTYLVSNLHKGGVIKLFDTESKKLLLNDCGLIGRSAKGKVLTSQWVDDSYHIQMKEDGFSVAGALHPVPFNTVFTPIKNIIFTVFMLCTGWHARLSYQIKGMIRKVLVFTNEKAPVLFYRDVSLSEDRLTVTDVLRITDKKFKFESLQIGDEFFVRYVPQSLYFQSQELDCRGWKLTEEQLKYLNNNHNIELTRTVDLNSGEVSDPVQSEHMMGSMGIEYSERRKKPGAFRYRFNRRGRELIRTAQRYFDGEPREILDIGPAEGAMLSRIQDAFPGAICTGLEYSQELIDACTDPRLKMVQGDCMDPPFQDGSFDIITASAVIEHVSDAQKFTEICHRLLRPGGLLIITTPDPFFDRIAEAIGHVADDIHQELFTLKTLRTLLERNQFTPLEVDKFMCSPFGCPGELLIEKVMKTVGLRGLLLNQIVVGRK